ncbi:MAG: methionyl-tRNA formyltransferase [Candidatus Firestonebacteria bacterium]|nr:methionyl-tRNA formyltransferase [Candidatus Firestonebacteria bacterium]
MPPTHQEKPRLLFMGTPDFAVPTLRHLAARQFPLAAVVTRPDKPKGRGYAETPSAVKLAAQAAGLDVWQPESVNTPEFLERLKQAAVEIVVVAAFGQILKNEFLATPPLGCVNLHASLLPKYRGAAPVQWAIARGETQTGITVQKMAERVDSGDVLVQRTLAIGPDETEPSLLARLADLGGDAVEEALLLLQASQGRIGSPQDESLATFAPRLTREDGKLDWTLEGSEINNRVRGFFPWPGTYALIRGERIKIITTTHSLEVAPAGSLPGTVLRSQEGDGWLVAAGQGTTVWVRRLQGANGKVMTAHAYTCGYKFGVNDRLE